MAHIAIPTDFIRTAAMKEAEKREAFVARVKAECRRRILLIMTEDKQRNTLAMGQAAVMQHGPDPAAWPSDLQAQHEAAMIAWTEINRLRVRSNEIELLDPMPEDLTADILWAPEED